MRRLITILLTLCMLFSVPMPAFARDYDNFSYVSAYATDGHGSVSVSPKYAQRGETVTVTVSPDVMYTLETITVRESDGRDLNVQNIGNNQYVFTMPDHSVEVRVSFMDDNSMIDFFVGASDSDDYYNAFLWAQRNGIISGIVDNYANFSANSPCTRAELVTFLWRAAGRPSAKSGTSFTDVDETAYYGEAVLWAAGQGIVAGYGNGAFGTVDNISNQQVVTILYRYAKYRGMDVSVGQDTNILSYNDAFEISDYAFSAYQWACGANIVRGNNGNLMPSFDCTIEDIITWMYHLLG